MKEVDVYLDVKFLCMELSNLISLIIISIHLQSRDGLMKFKTILFTSNNIIYFTEYQEYMFSSESLITN